MIWIGYTDQYRQIFTEKMGDHEEKKRSKDEEPEREKDKERKSKVFILYLSIRMLMF